MTRRARVAILVPALAGLAALLFWGFTGLPDFGHYRGPYGFVLNRVALPERHTTNVVAAAVFDYRGFDTLGEEFILFTAVLGVALLLREREEQKESEDADEVESDGVPGIAVLVALVLAQEHRDPEHRREEDELLAERVEAAVVEDGRADDVRRVPLRRG